MFVRFVRMRVLDGKEPEFVEWYRSRVIPALSAMQGCVFAGLLTPWRSEDHRSLTVWRTTSAAVAYERSGLYHELLAEAAPMLSGRTEWRARLTRESGETTDAEVREIPPDGFVIDAGDGAVGRLGDAFDSAFVRIVSIRVAPDRIGEFVSAYSNTLLPALRQQAGFLGGLLAEGTGDDGACLSISIWAREEDAARYELSGSFAELTESVKGTFSPVYTWGLALDDKADRDPLLAAPKVSSYQLVVGKKLDRRDS